MPLNKKEAIKTAKQDAEFRNMEYAVVRYKKGYAVFTLQSAIMNGEEIIFRTDNEIFQDPTS